jgi:5-methyltetrahydrofolate--homocysteine methyltransferase
MIDLQEIAELIIQGKVSQVKELVREAVDEEEDVQKILNEGLLAGMSVVGDRFKKGEFYVPEVLVAARAMKEGMEILKPFLVEKNIKGKGTIVLGTVKGDLHDIGKNLVGMMLEGAGFEVVDLGVDVAPEKFIQAAKEKSADITGLSALLTTTMLSMKDVIGAVEKEGLKGKVKVIIGGAPVTQDYANEIRADGYAPDAASAVDVVKELLAT